MVSGSPGARRDCVRISHSYLVSVTANSYWSYYNNENSCIYAAYLLSCNVELKHSRTHYNDNDINQSFS